MPRAISFSLTFSTEELARRFVDEAAAAFGIPTLRYEKVVHIVAADADEMREVMSIGRRLGAEDL